MLQKIIIRLLICCTLSITVNGQVEVTKDNKNIVSLRIEGSWDIDQKASKELFGKDTLKDDMFWHLVFRRDEEVMRKLQTRYTDAISKSDVAIYFAGWIKLVDTEYPCMIAVDDKDGNNTLVIFMQNELDKPNQSENDTYSAKVMLVVGHAKSVDKLYMGGINTSSGFLPFFAYQRKK